MPIEMKENLQIQKHNAPVVEYRRAANATLAQFTNEMSQILRNSIQRLDNISLKVRNCVYTVEGHGLPPNNQHDVPSVQENKHREHEKNPVVAVIEYKKSAEEKLEAKEMQKPLVSKTSPNAILVDKVVERLKSKIKTEGNYSAASFPSTIRRRKKNMGTVIDNDILREQSVIHRIRETHKEMRSNKSTKGSQEKIREKKRRKRAHLRKLMMQRGMVSRQGQKIASCYRNENFDDNLWFGAKIRVKTPHHETEKCKEKKPERPKSTSERKTHKVLKLARKRAKENFHDDKPSPEKIFSIDNTISPKLNADKTDEWCVIMETQKHRTPRCELKQNCPFAANNILDEVTLKDLEPLKAEYPRRDHLKSSDVDNSLLCKLLNDHQSLEYLVDVTRTSDDENYNAQKHRHKLNRTPYTKHARRGIDNIPEEESYSDSNRYDVMDKNTNHLLKKYILSPEGANKTYLVMPVLVQFDKEITPHISINAAGDDRKSKSIYTDATRPDASEILRPYIFSKDSPIEVPETTVMTLSQKVSQNQIPQRKPRMVYNASGHKVSPGEKDTVLYKKNSSPRSHQESKTCDSQQLVTFIVDKDQKNSVEQMYIPPTPKLPRKYPSANFQLGYRKKVERTDSSISGLKYKAKKKEENALENPEEKKYYISAKPVPKTTNLNEECEFSVLHEAKLKAAKKSIQRIKAEQVLKTTSAITKKILNKWQSLENPSIVDIAKKISKEQLVCQDQEKAVFEVALKQKAEKCLEMFPVSDNKTKLPEKVMIRKIGKVDINKNLDGKPEDKIVQKNKAEAKVSTGDLRKKDDKISDDEKNNLAKRKTPLESKPQTISPNEKLQIKPIKMPPPVEKIPTLETIVPTRLQKNSPPPSNLKIVKESPKFGYAYPSKESPKLKAETPVKDVKTNVGDDCVGMWMEINKNSSVIEVKRPRTVKSADTTTEEEYQVKDIEDLEKQLGEETVKFCDEVDQVLKQIQEDPVIQSTKLKDSFLQKASNILKTPFIQAVSKFRSEDKIEDFLTYLEEPATKTAIFVFLPRHMSSIKVIRSILGFAKYYGPTCEIKKWTDSELNIAVQKEDIQLHLKVVESVCFPVLQDFVIKNRAREINVNTEDLLWTEQPALPEQPEHPKLLTCVYSAVFATVFCGLNLQLQCD